MNILSILKCCMDEDGNVYLVEKIIDKRKHKGKVQYKVKWEGYAVEQATWEPLEHLGNVKEMVREFLNRKRKGKECCDSDSDSDNGVNVNIKNDINIDIGSSSNNVNDNNSVKYLKVISVNRDMKAKVEIEDNEGRRIKEIDTKVLREICPVILIDFYETKLKFTDKK